MIHCYNLSSHFWVCSLVETHHVVQTSDGGYQAVLTVWFDIPHPILIWPQQNKQASQSSGQTFQFFVEEKENCFTEASDSKYWVNIPHCVLKSFVSLKQNSFKNNHLIVFFHKIHFFVLACYVPLIHNPVLKSCEYFLMIF